jgi:hypothetical protein
MSSDIRKHFFYAQIQAYLWDKVVKSKFFGILVLMLIAMGATSPGAISQTSRGRSNIYSGQSSPTGKDVFTEACGTSSKSSEDISEDSAQTRDIIAKQVVVARRTGDAVEAGYWKGAKTFDGETIADQIPKGIVYIATTNYVNGERSYRASYGAGVPLTGNNEVCIKKTGQKLSTYHLWSVYINGKQAHAGMPTLYPTYDQIQYNIEKNNNLPKSTFIDGSSWENLRFKITGESTYRLMSAYRMFSNDNQTLNSQPPSTVPWRSVYEQTKNRILHYTK